MRGPLRSSRLKPVAAALFLLLLATATAEAREIRWTSLDVTADLDAEGVLHVRERQHMVMTGDWNGGERGFRVRPGQDVIVHGITRIDPRTGQSVALAEGDLADVDEYGWTSVTMLRWRSRLSTDPVFDATPLTYELDYSLYGVLQEENGVYVLDHDFVFPVRDGVIAEHTATLRIDPAWRVDGPRERTIRTGILLPGAGNLVRLTLTPASGTAVSLATSPRQARLVLALWGVPLLLLLYLFSSEWIRGRLAPLDPGAATDEGWLAENLLAHPAEVVGAVWDRGVSADEVAALVARLTADKTLETRVDDADIMHLTLKADREGLGGYVRPLVDGFFFDDRTETSTAEVREHYRKTGFDPAAKIRAGLEERAAELVGPSTRHWWLPVWIPTFLAFWGGVYLLYRTPGAAEGRIGRILAIVVPALLLGGVGAGIAADWRGRIDRGLLGAVSFLIPMALLLGAAGMAVTGFRGVPILGDLVRETGGLAYQSRLAATLIALAMANSIVNAARSRERSQGIALRKRLASVRRYFELELERPQPALRDEWFPYVLAFGLDDAAQLWFKSYGAERDSRRSSSWSTSTSSSDGGGSSSGSSSPSSWSGGGGAFGGAGASGSWAAAAGGLSAAISAPSSSGGSGSSGGGGGGGGGGGSSGGGSGGGW